MYLQPTKSKKNVNPWVISFFATLIVSLPWPVAVANEYDHMLDDYLVSGELQKVNTTIDPELQLALDVSYRIESDSGKCLVGDNGRSKGPLHIQKQAIDDVNDILGYEAFSYDDRMSLEKSCQIFHAYLSHYGNKYSEKTGKKPTTEVYVRIWNGGPNGWKKNKTKDHWEKAQEVIF